MKGDAALVVWVGAIALVVVVACVFFVGMWGGVVFLLARLSGWARLARKYRVTTADRAGPDVITSGRIGAVRYRNVLRLAVDDVGLHLRVFKLFAFGHPPLSIPWDDVRVSADKRLFAKLVCFDVDGVVVAVLLSSVQRLAKKRKLPPALETSIQEVG